MKKLSEIHFKKEAQLLSEKEMKMIEGGGYGAMEDGCTHCVCIDKVSYTKLGSPYTPNGQPPSTVMECWSACERTYMESEVTFDC